MKITKMTLGLLAFSLMGVQAFAEVECKSIYRLADRHGVKKEEVKSIPLTYRGGDTLKFETELEQDIHLSAIVYEAQGEVLFFLVKGPEYIDGMTSRGSLSTGYASLASTEMEKQLVVVEENGQPVAKEINTGNYTVYKIECYSR